MKKIKFRGIGEYIESKNVFYSKKYNANYIISDCKKIAIVNSNEDCLYNHVFGGRLKRPNSFENIEIPRETKIYKKSFPEHGTMSLYRGYWLVPFMRAWGYYHNKDLEFSTDPFREKKIIIEFQMPGEFGMPFFHSDALSHEEMNELILEIFLSPKKETQAINKLRELSKIEWDGAHSNLDVTLWGGGDDPVNAFDYWVSGYIKRHARILNTGEGYSPNHPEFKIKEATEIVAKEINGVDFDKYESLNREDIINMLDKTNI